MKRTVAVVVVLVCAGCGSSSSSPSSSASAAARQADYGLTGYGATGAAWNAHHAADADFAPGAVYNKDPTLPRVNGHTGADYTQVLHENGHVLGYDLHFKGDPIRQAKAVVFGRELPRDAKPLWFAVKDTCAQMLVKSPTLAKALGSKSIGDTSGTVLIEFGSGVNEDHYDPHSISDALFMLAEETSAAQAPGC